MTNTVAKGSVGVAGVAGGIVVSHAVVNEWLQSISLVLGSIVAIFTIISFTLKWVKGDSAKTLSLIFGLALLLVSSGCVHLPSPGYAHSALPVANPMAPAGNGGTVSAVPSVDPGLSPAHVAIQRAVNWMAVLMTIGGAASIGFGILLIYGGHIMSGLQLIVAGLLLPIFGIWFAYHWLLVVILCLLGGAVFFLATHFAVVKPLMLHVEAWAQNIIQAKKTV